MISNAAASLPRHSTCAWPPRVVRWKGVGSILIVGFLFFFSIDSRNTTSDELAIALRLAAERGWLEAMHELAMGSVVPRVRSSFLSGTWPRHAFQSTQVNSSPHGAPTIAASGTCILLEVLKWARAKRAEVFSRGCGCRRPPRGAAVGTCQRLPMGQRHLLGCG